MSPRQRCQANVSPYKTFRRSFVFDSRLFHSSSSLRTNDLGRKMHKTKIQTSLFLSGTCAKCIFNERDGSAFDFSIRVGNRQRSPPSETYVFIRILYFRIVGVLFGNLLSEIFVCFHYSHNCAAASRRLFNDTNRICK